jgi:capsular polysaccharide biosynthesis protein
VNDPHKITWPSGNGIGDYPSERLWTLSDFTGDGEPAAAEATGGLASLKFITAALRRRVKFWCTTAVVGLVVGCGLYVASPPGYQASTSVWLVAGPYENINTAANNDQAMAQTRTVAGLAVQQLGLREDAASFLATYKVIPVTERVIVIMASARSSDQAVRNASAVAAAFLKFRGREMEAQQALLLASLNQQAQQAQQRLKSINSQISQLPSQPTSSAEQAQLKKLLDQKAQAESNLSEFQQAAFGSRVGNGSATEAAVKGSYVLDPATPLAHSRLKPLILNAAVGLVAGLFLGMAIVIIGALVSDRLRRRDDVAQALGAPVRLSVGALQQKRWLPVRGGSAAKDADIQRIAAHLRHAVRTSSRDPASLAVVPVDDQQVPALSLVALAVSCAREGKQVVVADLCHGAPAAKLLGASDPGVRAVSSQDARLIVVVPERDDPAPLGPFHRELIPAERSDFTKAVADACVSTNLLLTLAAVDPSVGGDHLATWATDAVAVVTAGQSSWEKIHGVGELVRLSGTRLASAVLVGADKTDESIGIMRTPESV